MNPFLDDPTVTAYVLGELSEEQALRIRQKAQENRALQEAITEISAQNQALSALLSLSDKPPSHSGLHPERKREIFAQFSPQLAPVTKATRSPSAYSPSAIPAKRKVIRHVFYVAMGTAAIFCFGLFCLSLIPSDPQRAQPKVAAAAQLIENVELDALFPVAQVPADNAPFAQKQSVEKAALPPKLSAPLQEFFAQDLSSGQTQKVRDILKEAEEMAPLADVQADLEVRPLSPKKEVTEYVVEKLPFASGNARYNLAKRFLREGQFPPANVVRYEEFINAYEYSTLPQKGSDDLFVTSQIITTPWDPDTRLVAILFQERRAVKNVRASLEINPSAIQNYRLLGYESTSEKSHQLPHLFDGSNMIIYEITPTEAVKKKKAPLIKLHTQWQDSRDQLVTKEHLIELQPLGWENPKLAKDFKIAVTLAYFAHYLKSDLDDSHLRRIVAVTRTMRPFAPSFAESYQMITTSNSIVEFNSLKLAKPRIEIR